ncbi:MAG: bifunctional UDP-sugar hydrolase/5'-nucleotidase [Verrucomicrobiota bacterium]
MDADRQSKHRVASGWGGRRISFAGGALCAAAIAALLLAPALLAREVTVTLLHTADVHGRVAAVNSERENKPGGGLLRCATRIAEIRRRDANVILVDCGDLFQGAPESFLTRNRIIVESVRQLQYDALVPGNHEFDGGVEALDRFYEQAKIPVLAANIRSSREPALPGAGAFLCKEVDGVRVAILGLTTPLIPMWSRPHLLGDMTFEDSLSALRRVMPLVRAQKPDILVLAAHQGWRKWGDDPANEINAIARAFPEFDVILGAHTHQAVEWETVHGVAYTQAGCYGLWLGVVRLVFDTQSRRVKSKQIQLLAVDSGVAPDKALEDQTARSLKETKTYLDQEVGVAAVELKPVSRGRGQSAIQTLIAAAIAERVQADVVIHRALTEASLRAGPITMRDVWRIVPYENYIGVAHLTLDELRQILEENSGFFKSREFRGVYGLTYELQPKAAPGKRVSNIQLTSKCRMKNAECRIDGDGKEKQANPEGGLPTDVSGDLSGVALAKPEVLAKAGDRPAHRSPLGENGMPTPARVRVAFNSYDMASAGGRFPRLRAILDQSTSCLEEYPDADTRDAVLAYIRRHQPLDVKAAPGAHVVH